MIDRTFNSFRPNVKQRGFTLTELLVVIAIINILIGLLLNNKLVANNINHALNNVTTVLSIENSPQTSVTSVWSFRCIPTDVPTLSGSWVENPRFEKGDYRTTSDPGGTTTLTSAQVDATYLEQAENCRAMFDDSDVKNALCKSSINVYGCYSITTRVQNSLFGISEASQYRFKSVGNDSRCLQVNAAGSPRVYNIIPPNP